MVLVGIGGSAQFRRRAEPQTQRLLARVLGTHHDERRPYDALADTDGTDPNAIDRERSEVYGKRRLRRRRGAVGHVEQVDRRRRRRGARP
jgi:hypothetical protein